jgi:hypothetical protein
MPSCWWLAATAVVPQSAKAQELLVAQRLQMDEHVSTRSALDGPEASVPTAMRMHRDQFSADKGKAVERPLRKG